jgi:hypothetical protein
VPEQRDDSITGQFSSHERQIEFSATRSAPLGGAIAIRTDRFAYDLEYDYEAGEVMTDGHGGAIDRATQHALTEAITAVALDLGAHDPSVALHLQMLLAGLALLQQSAGMALPQMRFSFARSELDKSLENDGVTCIERDAPIPSPSTMATGSCSTSP